MINTYRYHTAIIDRTRDYKNADGLTLYFADEELREQGADLVGYECRFYVELNRADSLSVVREKFARLVRQMDRAMEPQPPVPGELQHE